MQMAASIIVNETLYIIQNYFGKVGETNLVTTIVGFYDDDEVVGAKDVLYNVAESLKLEGAPRLVKRKAGENKRRLDCDDIIALWKAFDKLPNVPKPTFAAVKASRVPSFSPSEVDIVSLTQTMINMKSQMESLKSVVEALNNKVDTTTAEADSLLRDSGNKLLVHETQQVSMQPMSVNVISPPTFADLMRTKQNGEWVTVTRKPKPTPEPVRRLVGSGGDQRKIKAVTTSGPKTWHVFVGRLAPETSEEDLRDFLNDWRINVIDCSILTRREKWHEKYAAFHVSVEIEFKDAIFDAVEWPQGADVRDWAFKAKSC